jgi:hypothetical protein
MTVRRLISISIITGVVLSVAQAAVAQLTTIPITVTSQTLEVKAFGMTTGPVTGGSSVGTPWNFGNADGSTAGSVTSELVAGELVITITGALSKGATAGGARLFIGVSSISLGLTVPNYVAPVFLQLTKVNSDFIGPVESDWLTINPADDGYLNGEYSSQLLNGLSSIGYIGAAIPSMNASVSVPLISLLPNDTIQMNWESNRGLKVEVDNSIGTFSETFTIRVVTVPEPSASLTIPSGAVMLLALAKLRGAALTP